MALSQQITRTYPLTVTVPALTPVATPVAVPWKTEDAVLSEIEILIPPGPNGTTGVRVMKGDVQLLPWGAASWIVGNDYNRTFPIGGYLPTSDITVEAYNLGQYPHSFYLRMSVTTLDTRSSSSASSVIDLTTLEGTPASTDPLSPDAILGSDTTDALVTGTLTADEIMPLIPEPSDSADAGAGQTGFQ